MLKFIIIFSILNSTCFAISLPSNVKYLTFKMHPSGHKEDEKKGYINNYYGFDMKMKSLLIYKDGYFIDILGNKIDTLKNISCDSGLNIDGGYSKYVMDSSGNIFINNETYQIKHSYFLSGKEAADAGWMKIKKGKLKQIVHDSGHYRPQLFQNLQLINELTKRGVKKIDIIMFYNDFLGKKFINISQNNIREIKNLYFSA